MPSTSYETHRSLLLAENGQQLCSVAIAKEVSKHLQGCLLHDCKKNILFNISQDGSVYAN